MKTETRHHTGREIARCTMKPHRLTCINPPENVRTEKRSARALGQKDEHGGSTGPGPEPPLNEGRSTSAGPAGPGSGVPGIPAGGEFDGPANPAVSGSGITVLVKRSGTQGLAGRRESGNLLTGIPIHPQDRHREMPAGAVGQQDPAGGTRGSGVLPAPESGGGGPA